MYREDRGDEVENNISEINSTHMVENDETKRNHNFWIESLVKAKTFK